MAITLNRLRPIVTRHLSSNGAFTHQAHWAARRKTTHDNTGRKTAANTLARIHFYRPSPSAAFSRNPQALPGITASARDFSIPDATSPQWTRLATNREVKRLSIVSVVDGEPGFVGGSQRAIYQSRSDGAKGPAALLRRRHKRFSSVRQKGRRAVCRCGLSYAPSLESDARSQLDGG